MVISLPVQFTAYSLSITCDPSVNYGLNFYLIHNYYKTSPKLYI